MWSDGSHAKHINLGFTHPYPDNAAYKAHNDEVWPLSETSARPQRIKMLTKEKSSLLHCSAFELFPDHTHVTLFPVNCSAKYWTKVLCEKQFYNVKENRTYIHEGNGEYLVQNNTLLQREHICPSGFQFIVDEFCVMLQLIDKPDNKQKSFSYLGKDHCKFSNSSSLTSINREHRRTDILYTLNDILEEFFAEGSEAYIIDNYLIKYNELHFSYRTYLWLPPPHYPTYFPCFKARDKTSVARGGKVPWYMCEDGSVIPDVLVCNGKSDCSISEDEGQCSVCSPGNSFCSCSMFHYQCEGGGCVLYDHLCDSIVDCPHGDDETFCHGMKVYPYFNGKMIKMSFITDLCDPPEREMLMCRSKLQCYKSSEICHYDHSDGVMAYCEDGSHIGRGSLCHNIECRKHYKCPHSYCIPTRKVCDGVIDCALGDDEAQCAAYKCPGHMRCHGVMYCVPPHEICDGISHCPQQEDEKYCQTCPQGCQCKGTALYCNNVTTLILDNQFQSPSALMLYKSHYIFEKMYNYFQKFNCVWLLDLKYGLFHSLYGSGLNTSMNFVSVKFLYLNYQGLQALPPYFIEAQNLLYLNLSSNIIQAVKENAFSLMHNIQRLSFVSNKLISLESDFVEELSFLSHLYLSDNPLTHIVANTFSKNPELMVIRSEWYMICCVAFVIKDCQPQKQFVSSCSNLISSNAQRTIVLTQGIIIIICNVGALVVQCVVNKRTKSETYLIVSLIMADWLMGVYLLAMATVDLTYSAIFYQIVSEWTNSMTCIIIGLINYISSEMSLLILSILSFYRMISISKVGGMEFMKSQVKITCVLAWSAIVISGVSYTVYLFNQNMGVRNSMCILLGISDQGFKSTLEYIFQVIFVSMNMIFLAVIIVSMASLFHKVIKSYQLVVRTSGKHAKYQNIRLIHTGLRMLLLLVCNVFTWIPFLAVSIMLLCGLPVHENVLQWVVVIGIPICACTDPILYNLASLRAHSK